MLLLLLLAAVVTVDYYAYPYGAFATGRSFNLGKNGLWLRYTWYFGKHSDAEVSELAQRLRERQIRFAYFHVRSVQSSGRLAFHYPEEARRLLKRLRRSAPDLRALAWVYVGNPAGRGGVDLSRPETRRAMVEEAKWLVQTCGFDGVQWDYEICPDGDAGLLALLRETRAALPARTLISVATPIWLPPPLSRWGWSDAYFRKVAALSDQIAVMCYDSAFRLPRSYVWLVRQETLHVTQDVAAARPLCTVIFGVPTYGPAGFSHDPRAENLGLALKGVREGLDLPASRRDVCDGVALFADYTTDAGEWEQYRALWLTTGPQR